MSGSVKRDPNGKTWGYIFDAPRRANERRRQVRKRGFANKRDADKALREQTLRAESERVALGAGSLDPLGEFVKIYIESLDGIAPSTRASYEGMIDNHVCNTQQGDLPINTVTAVDVESILSRARKRPGRSGSLLSPKTLRNLFIFLNSAFTYAVTTGRIESNPMTGLKAPQLRRDPEAMKFWTPDVARSFLSFASRSDDPVVGWIVHLAILTGMRRGELAGLRWNDIDLESQTLSIAHTRISVHNKVVSGPPKTDRSRRTLRLSAPHIETLTAVRARQDGDAILFGEYWEDSGFIFTDDHGKPIHPDAITRRFKRLIAKGGFSRIRFHDLRHTHASIAIHSGEHIKAVSSRLGHNDIGFTLRQYTHLMPENQGLPADGVVAALDGPGISCDQTRDHNGPTMQAAPSEKGA